MRDRSSRGEAAVRNSWYRSMCPQTNRNAGRLPREGPVCFGVSVLLLFSPLLNAVVVIVVADGDCCYGSHRVRFVVLLNL